MVIKVKEAYGKANILDQKRNSKYYKMVKTLNIPTKKILKAGRRNDQLTYKERLRSKTGISTETLKARRNC